MDQLIAVFGGLLVAIFGVFGVLLVFASVYLPFFVWAIHRRFITLNKQVEGISEVLENIEALTYSLVKGKDEAE